MEENSKPLAVGHLKEISLFKRIPEPLAAKILSEFVKKKTGKSPEIMNTVSGVILYSEYGKIFFRNGEVEFDPSPFHVKKVKSWLIEIKNTLRFYASKIYIAEVKKVLQEQFSITKEQELKNGGLIFELRLKENVTLRLVVTPNGRVGVFPEESKSEAIEKQAFEVIKTLESRGLLDF